MRLCQIPTDRVLEIPLVNRKKEMSFQPRTRWKKRKEEEREGGREEGNTEIPYRKEILKEGNTEY